MRICLVTTEYPPGPMGGVGTYSVILPPLLVAAGHEVTVLTKHFGEAPACETVDGVAIHRLPHSHEYTGAADKVDDELFHLEMHSLRSYVGVFAREVWRKLAELHRGRPFDVVLSQDVEAPTWLAQDRRMLFNELADLPFVVFIHSPHWQIQYYNEDSQFNRHEYHRHLYETHSMALADGLIAASRAMGEEIVEQLGVDRTRLRRIPLPLGPVPELADFSQRHDVEERRIVYSGRIELRKGVDTLLRAVVPLLRADKGLSLHLIGRDMPHPTLGGTVREKLTARLLPQDVRAQVVFRGWMPREALWAEYASATLGVIPSPWEPFSFVCQELMACGTPVVATRTGGMADMIEDGRSGLLCEPDDVDALRATLAKALAAPAVQRKAWGDAAADRIRTFCDNDEIVDATLAFFQEVIARNLDERGAMGRVPVPGNLPFADRPCRRTQLSKKPQPIQKPVFVVPCYNLGDYLPECLDSLAAQTREDWEAVIVDDGSTDPDTLAALEAAGERPRVHVLHFANGGLPVARNRGAQAAMVAGADALMFLDADDRIEPTYLEKATAVLDRHPEASAVTAWTHTIGMMHTYWAPPHPQFPFLLAECMSTPPGLIRASDFQSIGGVHEEFKYAFEDWDTWISLCATGRPVLMIPEPLIVYRMRTESMSRMFRASTREHGRLRMLRRHGDLFKHYASELTLLTDAFRYGDDARYQTELQPMKEHLERALRDLKWNQEEWKYWKAQFEGEKSRHADLQAALEAAQLEAAATRAEADAQRAEAAANARRATTATSEMEARAYDCERLAAQAALLRAELDRLRQPLWKRLLNRKEGDR